MTLFFKYKEVARSNNIKAITPSIPVTLSGSGGEYEFMILLDSGADVSAIPKHMGELLGLNLNGKREKAFGIGGSTPCTESYMNLRIGNTRENYSFKLPVKIILDNSDFPPLIGRAVFFNEFNITFKQSEKRVSLKKVILQKY